jgi:hypothetical protein
MAKAKKTESAKKDVKKAPAAKAKPTAAVAEKKAAAPAAKAPAAKAPAKKAVAKKSAPPQTAGGGTPLIDTDLLAQNAASMLRNRSVIEGAQGALAEGKESAAFKNLKDQLAKPKPTGLSGLFGPAGEQKKSGGGFNPNQQRGHNQTFGGMKTGVPRRTNG